MLSIFLNILFLILGFVMLAKGSDWFVDGAAGIATKLKIPQLVIGLTIVAMGTSAPEAAVSISAAVDGNADITIGNIVGSNILNILIILGLAAVIIPVAVGKQLRKIDIPFSVGITLLLLWFGCSGNNITRIEGVILLLVFAVYLAYLFISAKKNPPEAEEIKELSIPKAIIFTIVGLAVVILGSNFTVETATNLAEKIGIPDSFIGLTIVALGTSLPELFTSVTAARKGNADIAIGNIIGSNIFNILFVVGLSSLVIPVPFEAKFIADTIIAAGITVLLLLLSLKGKLGRWGGIILLAGYGAYFIKLLIPIL